MNNDIFPNKFKAALAAHQIQIGCWSALASPITTEVLGLAGFDWLVLDGEHAPNDISTFIPQLMALKGSASAPVVRVPTNEPVIIKRLLDIGFYNFLIPFVESEEEAINAVAATRYRQKAFAAFPCRTAPICLARCRITSRSRTKTSPSWYKLKASRGWITLMRSLRLRALTVFCRPKRSGRRAGTSGQRLSPAGPAGYPAHFCKREKAWQAERYSGAGRSGCASLSGMGRNLCRRRQRSGRIPLRHAETG